MKTWMKVLGGGVVGLVGVLGLAFVVTDEERPVGTEGPAAEALADKMLAAVDADGWAQTSAVRFRMGPSRPLHLWDRQRGLVRSVAGDGDDQQVALFSTDKTRFHVVKGGKVLAANEAAAAVERAWADFINDSFWLNAPAMIRRPGTTRSVVQRDGRDALLVSYSSGGATPGDAYLWTLDDNGRPTSWKMWVGILPVGGVEVSWEEWTTLATGGVVARRHAGMGVSFRFDPLETATSAAALHDGKDPFAALLAPQAAPQVAEPASQPAQP